MPAVTLFALALASAAVAWSERTPEGAAVASAPARQPAPVG
jgi:hypothetical protein